MSRLLTGPLAWRWLLLVYMLGVVTDFAAHIHYYATYGDQRIEFYEWLIAIEASLFWPLDIVARLLLTLR